MAQKMTKNWWVQKLKPMGHACRSLHSARYHGKAVQNHSWAQCVVVAATGAAANAAAWGKLLRKVLM
jgi:hypothetical protein